MFHSLMANDNAKSHIYLLKLIVDKVVLLCALKA